MSWQIWCLDVQTTERTGLKTLMWGERSQIIHFLKNIWKLSYLENTWKTEMSGTWGYKLQNCISIFRLPLLSFILYTMSTNWLRCCVFEVSTIAPWPSVYPSCTCYSILYIIHNELSLVSSSGWYPLSMTLTSLSSMSSSQLADRGPKFITTFHSPPMAYLIYDSINNNPCCRMPWRPLCPSCPLPACTDYHQPFSPLKLYLLISLSRAITRFSRLMPRGKAKSDLPIAHSAISHLSQMISPWCWCQNLTESNIQTFQ